MKSPRDVTLLIARWLLDPTWILEDTPGFEGNREYLARVRKDYEEEWARLNLAKGE